MEQVPGTVVSSALPRFTVELSRTISCAVDVGAVTAAAAHDMVDRADYPLPPESRWQRHKDWTMRVFDAAGTEVAAYER
jgi:hypothetical protein